MTRTSALWFSVLFAGGVVSTLLQNLHRALHPRAVAVVGARKVDDYMWLRNMSTFTGGPVYSVNIDANEIPRY